MKEKEIERRLAALEWTQDASDGERIVVIYDPLTGLPLTPVPDDGKPRIWLPANRRDGERSEVEGP